MHLINILHKNLRFSLPFFSLANILNNYYKRVTVQFFENGQSAHLYTIIHNIVSLIFEHSRETYTSRHLVSIVYIACSQAFRRQMGELNRQKRYHYVVIIIIQRCVVEFESFVISYSIGDLRTQWDFRQKKKSRCCAYGSNTKSDLVAERINRHSYRVSA